MNPIPVTHDQEEDREIIGVLTDLSLLKFEYPPDLLTNRRAAFMAQIDQLGAPHSGSDKLATKDNVIE